MELKRQTLYEAIRDSAFRHPNVTAIYYQGKKISYRKFLKMVDDKARILKNVLNVNKGDVILIAQPNIPDTLALFYAVNTKLFLQLKGNLWRLILAKVHIGNL